MGLDTEVEKSLLGWAKCFARYKPKKWFVELSRGEDVFQLEPKQILLFNFPSCLQAEIFIIHPLSFPVQMTVDMQEIVTCCNVDCLIVEQILFKKKKKRGESSASAECSAWGKQMCMVVCSERNVLFLAVSSQQLAACASRRTPNVTRRLLSAPTSMGLRSASAKAGTSNTTRWTIPAEVLPFMQHSCFGLNSA